MATNKNNNGSGNLNPNKQGTDVPSTSGRRPTAVGKNKVRLGPYYDACMDALEGLNPTQCARVIRMIAADRCPFLDISSSPSGSSATNVVSSNQKVALGGSQNQNTAKGQSQGSKKSTKRPAPFLDKEKGKKMPANFHWKEQVPEVWNLQKKLNQKKSSLKKKFNVAKISDILRDEAADPEVIEFRSLSSELYAQKSKVRAEYASKTSTDAKKKRQNDVVARSEDTPMEATEQIPARDWSDVYQEVSARDSEWCKYASKSKGFRFCGYDRNHVFSEKTGEVIGVAYPISQRLQAKYVDAGLKEGDISFWSKDRLVKKVQADVDSVTSGIFQSQIIGTIFRWDDTVNWKLPRSA